jgi:hypothetical protein
MLLSFCHPAFTKYRDYVKIFLDFLKKAEESYENSRNYCRVQPIP